MINSGVYRLTLSGASKVYIGSSDDIPNRVLAHIRLLRNNKHHCIKLQEAFNENTKQEILFDILERSVSPLDLKKREKVHILEVDYNQLYNTINKSTNVCNNGTASVKVSKQVIDKVRKVVFKTKQSLGGFIELAVEEKLKKIKIK